METYENALPMRPQGEGASEPASFPSKDGSFDRCDTCAFAGDHSRLGTESFAAKCRELDGRSVGYRFIKRLFDIVFSLVVLGLCILLFPVTLIVLIVTAVSTKGFPIYVQKRVGRYGKPLHILKLRSMVADSDDVEKYLSPEQLAQWKRERKVDDDPRITRFGAICRKTSLDEMPQFLNVLVGQMSVIGPRPISAEEIEWFGNDAALYLSVPGGITGLWQSGLRNEASFENGERQRVELDYVKNAGLGLDAKCFFKTFGVMFSKRKTGR